MSSDALPIMDVPTTPPAISLRPRQNISRQSVVGTSTPLRTSDANRVHIKPASPEVISSLITTLSIISSPANDLFEIPNGTALSAPSSASGIDRHSNGAGTGGSFGIDYGAFRRPSLEEGLEDLPLDELAASPPVIRTAKPPSGFSTLTAPKSPNKDTSFKSLLRTSRPSSSSGGSKDRDDVSSIGEVSIEPGIPPSKGLKRMKSSESWGKKQARNSKGLMYMSSKERLRETERKRASTGAIGIKSRGNSPERLPQPSAGVDSFMAETPIKEESTPERAELPQSSATITFGNASINLVGGNSGGLGLGIPARDSSLRKTSSVPKKRSVTRPNRPGGKHEGGDGDETTKESNKEYRRQQVPDKKRHDLSTEPTLKLQESLKDSPSLEPVKALSSTMKTVVDNTKIEQRLAENPEEGAPSPAIAQRKSRSSSDYIENIDISSTRNKKSGGETPEVPEPKQGKRESKLKRLSAPLSPTGFVKEHNRSSSQTMPRKEVSSPEPMKQQVHVDDRPTSADSIDDAVDAYLCSPRLSQKIRHPQTGRTISFSEVGDSEGYAVFCCVGMGLTRYIMAFYDELALTLKLRLITPDRPGVGESEPYTDGTATPLSWPDDVYAICQALKITKFSILAHSAGAIYALATALRMPQHIRGRIHLLAPWIPPSQLNVSGVKQALPPTNSIPTSQRILRALPTPILKAANSSFMSATSTSITSSLPKSPRRGRRRSTTSGRETPGLSVRASVPPGPDKENQGPYSTLYSKPSNVASPGRANKHISDPNEAAIIAAAANTLAEKERQNTYDNRLTHAIWELATFGANPAVDLLVCLERRHTIGFRYVDINRAVVIHHGSKDNRVPVENVKWLGRMMRRCEVRILEGEGHGLMASAVVMGGVLTEIAREWEDWMRVVQQKPADNIRGKTLRERASVGAFR